MKTRVVHYSRTPRDQGFAEALARRLQAGSSQVLCPGYSSLLQGLDETIDIWTSGLPKVEVSRPIGPADWLVVGGPLCAGRLAPALRSLLQSKDRLPPVAGVFVLRDRVRSLAWLEDEIEALRPERMPALLAMSRADIGTRVAQARIGAFLREVAEIQTPVSLRRAG